MYIYCRNAIYSFSQKKSPVLNLSKGAPIICSKLYDPLNTKSCLPIYNTSGGTNLLSKTVDLFA